VLHPAPNRNVVHRQAAFRHHFFQVAVAKRVPQIPAQAQNDNYVLEVSSRNSAERFWLTLSPYQIRLSALLQQIHPVNSRFNQDKVVCIIKGAGTLVKDVVAPASGVHR